MCRVQLNTVGNELTLLCAAQTNRWSMHMLLWGGQQYCAKLSLHRSTVDHCEGPSLSATWLDSRRKWRMFTLVYSANIKKQPSLENRGGRMEDPRFSEYLSTILSRFSKHIVYSWLIWLLTSFLEWCKVQSCLSASHHKLHSNMSSR